MRQGLLCILFVIAFYVLPAATLSAQQTERYVVTSRQAVNARTCPRVTCGVARTFAPGEALLVNAVVEGESVSGSNEWLRISENGRDVFVHSSLATHSPDSVEAEEEKSSAPGTVNTSRWVERRIDSALLTTPRSWMTQTEILADEELIEALAEWYGMETDELIEAIEADIANNASGLILTDPFDSLWFYAWQEERDGSEVSMTFLKRATMSDIDALGGEVLSDEVLQLPAGNAIRIHSRYTGDDQAGEFSSEELIYIIVNPRTIFYLIFSVPDYLFAEMESTFDTVAQEFSMGRPNT